MRSPSTSPSRCPSETLRPLGPFSPFFAGQGRPLLAPTASHTEPGPPPPPPGRECYSGCGPPSLPATLRRRPSTSAGSSSCLPAETDTGCATGRAPLAHDEGPGRHPPPHLKKHRLQDARCARLPRSLWRASSMGVRTPTRVRPDTPRARQRYRARRSCARPQPSSKPSARSAQRASHPSLATSPRLTGSSRRSYSSSTLRRPSRASRRRTSGALRSASPPCWPASSRRPRRTFGQDAPPGTKSGSPQESPRAARSPDSSL